jgi:hypothetical protein
MAGTIEIAPDHRWSSSGWLFDWVVDFLAGEVSDPAVKATMREIVAENLGWLGLDGFDPAVASELRTLIRDRLVPAAEAQLPAMEGRQAAIEALRDLASRAA